MRWMTHTMALTLTLTLATIVVGQPTTAPATQPADAPATQPATQPAVDPQVGDWLDRIERQSARIKTFTADIRYDRVQQLLGDKQIRFGSLSYDAGPPAKVAVHFNQVVIDDARRPQDQWWIFDGIWLVERHDSQKQFLKRQVVDPQDKQADPLALGSGPFAVPLNARKQEVLRRFEVQLIDAAEGDPADTVHLRFTPRPGTQADFIHADLWYHRDTLLPVRVRTSDDSDNVSLIQLSQSKVNEPVDAKLFDTTPPTERGWLVEITPLQ